MGKRERVGHTKQLQEHFQLSKTTTSKMNHLHFIMSFATHAKTGKCYIVDGALKINDDDDLFYPESTLEDCDKSNIFTFCVEGKGKLNGVYYLYCDDNANDKYKLAKETNDGSTISEYVIDPANYTVDANRYKADLDDPMWEVLGYDVEEQEDDE
jgi:hypothetical protein